MISLNTQPIEKMEQSSDHTLDLVEIFATIQGEGPFAGERAVFVRTAGCNFQCPECDTDYTSNRLKLDYMDTWNLILAEFATFESANKAVLIVLTGGEPLRQNIGPFLTFLFNEKKDMEVHVQIETNGSLYRDDVPWFALGLTTVVSPKAGIVHEDLIPKITAYKYVLEYGNVDPDDGLPSSHLGNGVKVARPPKNWKKTTYIQPADVGTEQGNKLNLAACVDSCKKFGYRLGLQIHKIIGVA